MRTLSLTLAAAAAGLAFAAPASAQYSQYYGAPYAPQQNYGYGQAYGYSHYNPAQRLQMRVDAVQHFIHRLDRADRVPNRAAKELKREARSIERQIRTVAYGFNPHQMRDIERRLGRLEQRVSFAMLGRFGRGWERQNGHYGSYYNGYAQGFDRDDHDRRGGRYDRDHDRDWDDDDD